MINCNNCDQTIVTAEKLIFCPAVGEYIRKYQLEHDISCPWHPVRRDEHDEV